MPPQVALFRDNQDFNRNQQQKEQHKEIGQITTTYANTFNPEELAKNKYLGENANSLKQALYLICENIAKTEIPKSPGDNRNV
ncbi:MAG: hypothetical protein QXF76_02380 [Candidatus Anstonellales archaeon]